MHKMIWIGLAALTIAVPTSAMAQHHGGGHRGGHEGGSVIMDGRTHGYREPYHGRSEPYAYSYPAYPSHRYERPYRYERHQYARHDRPRHYRKRHHRAGGHH